MGENEFRDLQNGGHLGIQDGRHSQGDGNATIGQLGTEYRGLGLKMESLCALQAYRYLQNGGHLRFQDGRYQKFFKNVGLVIFISITPKNMINTNNTA